MNKEKDNRFLTLTNAYTKSKLIVEKSISKSLEKALAPDAVDELITEILNTSDHIGYSGIAHDDYILNQLVEKIYVPEIRTHAEQHIKLMLQIALREQQGHYLKTLSN